MKSTLAITILTIALLFPLSFVQAQTNGKDSISFKTTLESIQPPEGTFITHYTVTQLGIPQSLNKRIMKIGIAVSLAIIIPVISTEIVLIYE